MVVDDFGKDFLEFSGRRVSCAAGEVVFEERVGLVDFAKGIEELPSLGKYKI